MSTWMGWHVICVISIFLNWNRQSLWIDRNEKKKKLNEIKINNKLLFDWLTEMKNAEQQ